MFLSKRKNQLDLQLKAYLNKITLWEIPCLAGKIDPMTWPKPVALVEVFMLDSKLDNKINYEVSP